MSDHDPTPIRSLRAMLAEIADRPPPATLEELRAGLEQIAALNPPAADIRHEETHLDGVRAHEVWAEGASSDRSLLYLHGGGYVSGSPSTHRAIIGELSRAADARVIALDYAKAPEAPFPAAFEDGARGLAAMARAGRPFAVAGDSAGGGLALAVLADAAAGGHAEARALALFSPWTDLTLASPSIRQLAARDPIASQAAMQRMAAMYAAGADLRDPRLSPRYAALKGLPPTLIQVGSDEALLDDALEVDRAARAAGVDVTLEVWPQMIHVWHGFTAVLPQAKQALHHAGQFLKSRF